MENRQYQIGANRGAERGEEEQQEGQRESSRKIEAEKERERGRERQRESEKVSNTTPLLVRIRHFQLQLKDYFFFGGGAGQGAGEICKTTAISEHTPLPLLLPAPSSRQQKLCYKVKYCADCKLCTKKYCKKLQGVA